MGVGTLSYMPSDGAARGELNLLRLSRVVTELERSSRRGG